MSFTGQLRPEQHNAVRSLLKHQDGVLVAPPGSGKTVMACALIAERQVATAILVNRAELIHQWRERLTSYLDIDTKQIGQLGGGRKERTGAIDLIMMQSISHRDADPTILNEYGQIIVDECHAIAAPATEAAIRKVNVRFWTGLTATPFRADQMDELITMQCGPIRHVIETQTQGSRQRINHQTSFTTEEPGTDGASIQAIYNELSLDQERNLLIVDQIIQAASEQRYCLVLTNRITHLHTLRVLLESKLNYPVFTLHGQLTAQERTQTRQNIARYAAQNNPFVLLAIDKVAGEGLDIPTMDTLFLTMPVSFKGRIIQQAGRITRGSTLGQQTAVVHDFHDTQVPLLARMHRRRSKILQKEGFLLQPQLPLET
ncbi:MAG TPA: DEAD/DEAH box helicase [Enteractinococcus helveticum]|uniref:DEAD/DEAH box helicase n=1 Tax=Enteractinococcus helveticum TaxID=1837282 RepID=A0A921FNW4_9MICC|nr:DEAD/DEAH box helicase [Enteractinococcus helveticum]